MLLKDHYLFYKNYPLILFVPLENNYFNHGSKKRSLPNELNRITALKIIKEFPYLIYVS